MDPVPGGSASAYDYCSADPINCFDLSGQFGWHHFFSAVLQVAVAAATVASFFGCAICGAAVVVYHVMSAGDHFYRHQYRAMGFDLADAALGAAEFSASERLGNYGESIARMSKKAGVAYRRGHAYAHEAALGESWRMAYRAHSLRLGSQYGELAVGATHAFFRGRDD